MSIRIDFLSYEGERNNERHPHAQFVLPIAGELEISIGGAVMLYIIRYKENEKYEE